MGKGTGRFIDGIEVKVGDKISLFGDCMVAVFEINRKFRVAINELELRSGFSCPLGLFIGPGNIKDDIDGPKIILNK